MNIQEPKLSAIKKLNWSLIITIVTLLIIGLINLHSISHRAYSTTTHLFYLQLIWISLGIGTFLLISLINYHIFTRVAYILYGLNLTFLIMVSFFGNVLSGSRRWLDLGLFNYQPSETFKIILIFILARLLSTKRSWRAMTLTELIKPLCLILLPVLLIIAQPDLGTALMILIITISIIIFAKVHKNILLFLTFFILSISPIAWQFILKDYQKNRILTFISPGRDPRGTGYNTIQSKIAIGSGQFLGKGFQKGTQSQLEFLPERHTDFIFSVLSEEHGFVGSVITILLFLFLIIIGFHTAFQSKDKVGVFLCVGMSFYMFWHMFINIGMTMGILPVVGIPLPLLSYGGSSLLTTMTALGVISSVSYRRYLF
ncbi:MAG: rod shape-determining protein RodA [Bdellovibrionales bacterium]|nr:rod shape-determining protein RodA [Bdellovibrionales bacterium]